MIIRKFQPSAALQPFVKSFVLVESEDPAENRVLPDVSMTLAFSFRGEVNEKETLPSAVISGLRSRPRVLNYAKRSSTLVVAFREGGAHAFFPTPSHEIFGKSLPLEDILRRRQIQETQEKLSEARDNRTRIASIEAFLLSELKESRRNPLVFEAVSQIKRTRGELRIKELLKVLNTSRDPFEKKFRNLIGTSPQKFSQIVRLRSLISAHSPEKNLTELAAAAGYFDQAHFIKDVKAFTGLSPRRFFNSAFW